MAVNFKRRASGMGLIRKVTSGAKTTKNVLQLGTCRPTPWREPESCRQSIRAEW